MNTEEKRNLVDAEMAYDLASALRGEIEIYKTKAEHWEKVANAAEEVIKVMNVPKNKSGHNTLSGSGNEQFILFGERKQAWQKLKNQQ